MAFADFLQQAAEDFDAVRVLAVGRDLVGLAARDVGRGAAKEPDLGPLPLLSAPDVPGAPAAAELAAVAEAARCADGERGDALTLRLRTLAGDFGALQLPQAHRELEESRAGQLENLRAALERLEEVASKDLSRRKGLRELLGGEARVRALGPEQSKRALLELRGERIRELREAALQASRVLAAPAQCAEKLKPAHENRLAFLAELQRRSDELQQSATAAAEAEQLVRGIVAGQQERLGALRACLAERRRRKTALHQKTETKRAKCKLLLEELRRAAADFKDAHTEHEASRVQVHQLQEAVGRQETLLQEASTAAEQAVAACRRRQQSALEESDRALRQADEGAEARAAEAARPLWAATLGNRLSQELLARLLACRVLEHTFLEAEQAGQEQRLRELAAQRLAPEALCSADIDHELSLTQDEVRRFAGLVLACEEERLSLEVALQVAREEGARLGTLEGLGDDAIAEIKLEASRVAREVYADLGLWQVGRRCSWAGLASPTPAPQPNPDEQLLAQPPLAQMEEQMRRAFEVQMQQWKAEAMAKFMAECSPTSNDSTDEGPLSPTGKDGSDKGLSPNARGLSPERA